MNKQLIIVFGICILGLLPLFSRDIPMNTSKIINNEKNDKNIILETDQRISAIARDQGLLKAVIPYLDENAIIFPTNGYPLYGKDSIIKISEKASFLGRESILNWTPIAAEISIAADLGYTYGTFEHQSTQPSNTAKTETAYYLFIWKKNNAQQWKIVVSQGLLLLSQLSDKPAPNLIDNSKLDSLNKEIVETELAFSNYSVTHNRPQAFFNYIADNGVAIGGNTPRTRETYAELIEKAKSNSDPNAPKTTLEWKPIYSFVSSSGELAYDYGPWRFTQIDKSGNSQVFYGYFITIWQKQADKTWKFIRDCGNECPYSVY